MLMKLSIRAKIVSAFLASCFVLVLMTLIAFAGLHAVAAAIPSTSQAAVQQAVDQAVGATERNLVLIVLGTFLLGGFASFIVYRQFGASFNQLNALIEHLATGELHLEKEALVADDLKPVYEALEQMAAALAEKIQHVAGRSSYVAVDASAARLSAEQIAANTQDIEHQTAAAVAATQQLAMAANQISQSCAIAVERVGIASDSTRHSTVEVEKSVTLMQNLVSTVQGFAATVETLGAHSERIGAIVNVINEIANQTNLLALNAAIEAARAGEEGRGFAVVAGEVRNLAARTSSATEEIGQMIGAVQSSTQDAVAAMERSVHQVQEGADKAAEFGEALHTILAEVDAVSEQVHQMAAAATEQSAAMADISGNMSRISEGTQEAFQKANDSVTNASRMNSLAEELMLGFNRFKMDDDVTLAINKAKSAHMIFTGKIKAHLDGSLKLDANGLPTNRTCAFGKWYQSRGGQECGHLDAFRQIDDPHGRVHELGKKAVMAHDAGDKLKARELCQQMVVESQSLIELLDAVLAECNRDTRTGRHRAQSAAVAAA
jgi:methyl-accepting chemotaxis protein